MNVNRLLALFFPVLTLLFACGDHPDAPAAGPGNYTSGVFIVNEGPFGGSGSITWHNPATGETVQDIFAKANGGALPGQFLQSLTFHGDHAYLVVNGANKILVVDANSFQYIGEITGFTLPRYLLAVSDKIAWVSEWGANGLDGNLVKVDLETRQILLRIPVGAGPEKMLRQDDHLLVVNSGGFGTDSTLVEVNLLNDQITRVVTVPGKNPASLAQAALDGPETWVLARGDWMDPQGGGWLGTLTQQTGNYALPLFSDDLCTAPDGRTLYCTGGGGIHAIEATGAGLLFQQSAYGLGCDPVTGYLYCADARDFSSAGEVAVFRPDGQKVGAFPCGVAPGEIVFR